MFPVKKFTLFEILFPFPREWQGPQNKFNSKENKRNMTEHVFCSRDALTQTLCRRGNLFFLWGGNREQKYFWATRDNRKWKYLFSFQHTSKLTNLSLLRVFTLIIRHDLPGKFGQNHCPRIKQSPLPVECDAQTLGFVPGFVSAPHCDLNVTRVKIEFYQKNQAEIHFEARGTTRSGCWGWSSCFEKENHRKAMT